MRPGDCTGYLGCLVDSPTGLNGTFLMRMGIGIVFKTFWKGFGFKGLGALPSVIFMGGPVIGGAGIAFFSSIFWGRSPPRLKLSGTKTTVSGAGGRSGHSPVPGIGGLPSGLVGA